MECTCLSSTMLYHLTKWTRYNFIMFISSEPSALFLEVACRYKRRPEKRLLYQKSTIIIGIIWLSLAFPPRSSDDLFELKFILFLEMPLWASCPYLSARQAIWNWYEIHNIDYYCLASISVTKYRMRNERIIRKLMWNSVGEWHESDQIFMILLAGMVLSPRFILSIRRFHLPRCFQ